MKKVAAQIGDIITVSVTEDGLDLSKLTARVSCHDTRAGVLKDKHLVPRQYELYVAGSQQELLMDLWFLIEYDPANIGQMILHLARYTLIRSLLCQIGLITKATVLKDTDWEPYGWADFRYTGHAKAVEFCRQVGKAYGRKAESAQRMALKLKTGKSR